MVDFGALRQAREHKLPINPIEIFRRLPKPSNINDLYVSQANALEEWFTNRDGQTDFVIKLHTGGGKTLVGLLIAQSIINETRQPVLYLASTRQLVSQTLQKAEEYSISAVGYERSTPIDELLSPKHILVATYKALFNGKSRFGVRHSGVRSTATAGGIILDDAHTAFSTMRDAFTLRISRDKQEEEYVYLTTLFKDAFEQTGRSGYFDDIIRHGVSGVVEVPHWHWLDMCEHVRQYLAELPTANDFPWALIRDSFRFSHCLITSRTAVIIPMYPMVDLFPTFVNCPKRIFMSATIENDGEIIRTFDIQEKAVQDPIRSGSLAGVSERMILVPQLTNSTENDWLPKVKQIASKVANDLQKGTVVLVPSFSAAEEWSDIGTVADSENVEAYVEQLQRKVTWGPFIFANRYDGIDLPGDTCRLLILAELPKGIDEYDELQLHNFESGYTFGTVLAQRIEQGIGRAARGAGDYCVVLLFGRELVAWLGHERNLRLLTATTRAQIDIGLEISNNVTDVAGLTQTIRACLDRDPEWLRFHAENLAERTGEKPDVSRDIALASIERRAFQWMRDGQYQRAIDLIQQFVDQHQSEYDLYTQGWLLQIASRSAYLNRNPNLSYKLQEGAVRRNRGLFRPPITLRYEPLLVPGKQSQAIADFICDFKHRHAALNQFEAVRSRLSASSSAAQFEQALKQFGEMLGYTAERPENDHGIGPDVLWILDEHQALVIEVKNRKKADNAFTKEEHGQLLASMEWFKKQYPNIREIGVCVHPNNKATWTATPHAVKVLSIRNLNAMLQEFKDLLAPLCELPDADAHSLSIECERNLAGSGLTPAGLQERYLEDFYIDT